MWCVAFKFQTSYTFFLLIGVMKHSNLCFILKDMSCVPDHWTPRKFTELISSWNFGGVSTTLWLICILLRHLNGLLPPAYPTPCHQFMETLWCLGNAMNIQIFADFVISDCRKVDVALRYDCEDAPLALSEKANFLVVFEVNCMENNGLARSLSTNHVPRAVLICSYKNTISTLLAANRATKIILQDPFNFSTGYIVKLNEDVGSISIFTVFDDSANLCSSFKDVALFLV